MKSVWSLGCSSNNLYVSDRKKRQVVCFDVNSGEYKWRQKLGRPFAKPKKFLKSMDTGGLKVMFLIIHNICTKVPNTNNWETELSIER